MECKQKSDGCHFQTKAFRKVLRLLYTLLPCSRTVVIGYKALESGRTTEWSNPANQNHYQGEPWSLTIKGRYTILFHE